MVQGVVPFPDLPSISSKSARSASRVTDALLRGGEGREAYDFALVKMYIDLKFQSHKSRKYVLEKLEILEGSSSAANGSTFALVRDYYGFPASRVFRTITSTSSVSGAHTSTSSVNGARTSLSSVSPNAEDGLPPAYVATEPVVRAPPRPPLSMGTRRASTASSSTHTHSASRSLSSTFSRLGLGTLTASPVDRSGTSSPASIVVDGEHALEMLREYDTAFVIDDSTSMLREGRWAQACTAVRGVIGQACKHDDDGVDVYFLNASRDREGVRRPADIDRLFRDLEPCGATPTGETLKRILDGYMLRLERATREGQFNAIKPLNIIVITDGAPTDHLPINDLENVIVSCAQRLDEGDYPLSQVGIQFFQIGNDRAATAALRKLDDDLSRVHKIRDMVDTVPFAGELTPEAIVKILLGGVSCRLDQMEIL
ncbi:hypothetical protein CspeluHIS016_0200210 [Cutaneotrichosporon spelunceum]|uniref:VWFA domain-containing protein n=1 Tax=Cutaneotrichosporon spelunceum TaxID=1672016 RepID=A0AAD3Y9G4_9TREE|nr:hypothetical protein CspeluHIS016_0200210 [Cutaneotrichosporon spelunceum]